jgi:hypothetical protein
LRKKKYTSSVFFNQKIRTFIDAVLAFIFVRSGYVTTLIVISFFVFMFTIWMRSDTIGNSTTVLLAASEGVVGR